MANKSLRIVFLSLAIVLLVLAGFVFTHNLIDFPIYHLAGRSLLRGSTNLYDPNFSGGPVMDYRYPPFFLIAFLPLWTLPYKVAAYVWYVLCVVEIVLCVWAVRKALRSCAVPPRENGKHLASTRFLWLIALFTVGAYFVIALHYGNAHLLATALLFCSFYFAIWRRRIRLAALFIALAITIKLTPVLILPYFALKHQWRFLILVGAFLVALNLAPAAYFGFGQNAGLLKTWYRHVITEQEFHEANASINSSLKGQLRRYLTKVDYDQRFNVDKEYTAVNFAAWPQPFVENVAKSCDALLFVGGLSLIWWTARARNNLPYAASYIAFGDKRAAFLETGLMICLMLLVSPHTWKIYYIALLWPVAALAHVAASSKHIKRGLILLAILNGGSPLLPGRTIQRALLVVGLDFFVLAGLTGMLAYALIRHRREYASASCETLST